MNQINKFDQSVKFIFDMGQQYIKKSFSHLRKHIKVQRQMGEVLVIRRSFFLRFVLSLPQK